MRREIVSERGDALANVRLACYAAANYIANNPFARSFAEWDGALSIPELEQAIALGVLQDYPHLLEEIDDPLTRGRMLLQDREINPVVVEPDAIITWELLRMEVDEYFEMYRQSLARELAGGAIISTLDY